MESCDIAIIGAGIVGLATARKLQEARPGIRVALLEKESSVGTHQTARNSGVIHSGIYYRPGSLRALNCIEGYRELLPFLQKHDIPHDICGKLIVATSETERPRLAQIMKNGQANGLRGLRLMGPEESREIEPHVSAVESVYVPQTGITDYSLVARTYKRLIEKDGGTFHLANEVSGLHLNGRVVLSTGKMELEARVAVNCAGLYADKVAELSRPGSNIQIIPFRGEYYELRPEAEHLVNHLIYPVPDPDFPFLGVHFTRMIQGGIEAGPNAVLAFAREGYDKWVIDWGEFAEIVSFEGFRQMAMRHWRQGLAEMHRSWSKKAFVQSLQKLIPEIDMDQVVRGRAGVRAMACDRQGNMLDDFLVIADHQVVNVYNAPSPAATASLAIGRHISERALALLGD